MKVVLLVGFVTHRLQGHCHRDAAEDLMTTVENVGVGVGWLQISGSCTEPGTQIEYPVLKWEEVPRVTTSELEGGLT